MELIIEKPVIFKDEEIFKVICHFKSILKARLDKNPSEDFSQHDWQITMIHIIYNRLRRGFRRPHLLNSDVENLYLRNNKYRFDTLNRYLKNKNLKELSYEDVYNGK